MSKFWLVARNEYRRHVFRKRFIFALFSLPLLLLMMVLVVVLDMWMNSNPAPIGYIDHSGLLANPLPPPKVKFPERNVPMLAYTSDASARTDLQSKKIQAYYILPKDYLQTGQAQEFYLKQPTGLTTTQFDAFLAVNLLARQPREIADRIREGSHVTVLSSDKSRESSPKGIINIILPFLSGILFIIAMSTTSGYLIQAVVEEKENRTMEILVTSVSPGQLMSGKIAADMAVGATQLLVWTIFIALILVVGRSYIPYLSGFTFPLDTLAILLMVMVPAFVMISGLMAAVGATLTEASEGQQIMGLFTLPIWVPYLLITLFIQNPNSPLAIGLSLFPLTAPMSVALRLGFTNLPLWQIITAVAILVLSALGAVWLAGRAFRLGMLRFGKRLQWKEIFSRQEAS